VRALQAEQLRAENEAHEATDKGSNRRPSRPEPRSRIHLPPGESHANVDETGWGARFSQLVVDGIVAETLPAGMPPDQQRPAEGRAAR